MLFLKKIVYFNINLKILKVVRNVCLNTIKNFMSNFLFSNKFGEDTKSLSILLYW